MRGVLINRPWQGEAPFQRHPPGFWWLAVFAHRRIGLVVLWFWLLGV